MGSFPLFHAAYWWMAKPICRSCARQTTVLADSRATRRAGSSRAIRMAMMPMTTTGRPAVARIASRKTSARRLLPDRKETTSEAGNFMLIGLVRQGRQERQARQEEIISDSSLAVLASLALLAVKTRSENQLNKN